MYENGNGGFDGWWGIILIALLFGWGRNGYGGFGGSNGGVTDGYVLASDFANIERKIDGVNNGLCDGFYAMNTGMLNGFANTNTAISNLGFNMQDCCCKTQRAIDGVNYNMAQNFATVNYNMAKNTCDVIQSGKDNTQRIIDYMAAKDYANVQAENAALKAQLSNNAQSAYIVSQLKTPTPVPAYVVQNPYCCNGYYNNGCGASTL